MPATRVAMPPCTTQAAESAPNHPASSPSSMRCTQSGRPDAVPVNADSIRERHTTLIPPMVTTLVRQSGSGSAQVRVHPGQRVDRVAAARVDLEVQVRPGARTGVSDESDLLVRRDDVADVDRNGTDLHVTVDTHHD